MNNAWFQLVASLIAMVMIANLQYAWNLFVEPMRAHRGWELSAVQSAFAFFILLQTWVQPLDGWFIDKIGPRKFITAAGILCGIGWGTMGYASSLPMLMFFYGMAGIGAAFVYSASIGSALKWFPARRGFASGIIAAGFGGGSAIFGPIIAAMIDARGYQYAFLFTGILQGVVIVIVAQFLRHPVAAAPAPKAAPVAPGAVVPAKSRKNTENFTTWEMLGTPHFYVLYAMFVAMAIGGLFVTANTGKLVNSWGMTTAVLATLSFFNPLANGAARVFWGWASDRLGRENTMVLTFLLQALCLASVVTIGRTSVMAFTVTVFLVYFTWGQIYSLFPATLGDYFGSRNATSNYGFLYSAKGVAAVIGAPIAAMIFEATNTWSMVFYGSALLALLASVTAYFLRMVPLPQKAEAGVLPAKSIVR
jgi:OFA family oxalate/formate antiporter-like MFS transporter